MPAAEAIFFDLDNTLVSLNNEVLALRLMDVCQKLATLNPELNPVALRDKHQSFVPEHWRDSDDILDGASLMRGIWRDALDACGCNDRKLADQAYDLWWQGRAGIIQAYEDVADMLEQLHGSVPLVVITNGPPDTQMDKLDIINLTRYFDLFAASGGLGFAKPDMRIFQFALEKLSLKPANVWHVGDSLANDVAGANHAGLHSVWINREHVEFPAGAASPHYEIDTLSLLPALLGLK